MKKNIRFYIVFLQCFLIFFFIKANAQEEEFGYLYSSDYYYPQVDSVCSTFTVRHIEGGGIGYNKGYTTGETLIFPANGPRRVWPFIDLRGHYFNNSEWAANGGLGIRYNPWGSYLVYGFNTYLDYRSDWNRDLHFFQIGVGTEILSERWDFRLNGYIPLTHRRKAKKCFFTYPGEFFIEKNFFRVALTGLNAELGYYLFRGPLVEFYVGVGPYYYGGRVCNEPFGGQLRALVRYNKIVTAEGFISHDGVFKTRVQGLIGFHFPIGCSPRRSIKQQILSQPIQRNEIIVLEKKCEWDFNF